MKRFQFRLLVASACTMAALAACGDDDQDDDRDAADAAVADTGVADAGTPDSGSADAGSPDTGTPDTGAPDTGTPDTEVDVPDVADEDVQQGAAFTLQLLHVGDPEAGADAIEDGPRFVSVVQALRATYPDNTIALSSGDNWIPGAFYTAGADDSLDSVLGIAGSGRADIALLNEAGFQAAVFGNHEFDQGTGAVASILSPETRDDDEDGTVDATWAGAAFPYLSANLDFSANDDLSGLVVDDGQDASTIAGKIARSTVVTVAGERIGVIGATTPILAQISSPGTVSVSPEDPTDLDALAAIVQAEVDALSATGINKVILLSHMQQLGIERALAPLLTGVDIIVAGGSNTLLADEDDVLRPGDEAADAYPLVLAGADGTESLIVNTDGNLRYVGRLVVGFDEDGVIALDALDPTLNGAYATDEAGVAALGAELNANAAAITGAIRDVLIARDGNTFGWTDVYLDGRRGSVRTEETNLGNLSADAALWYAREVEPDVAAVLRNGGGIRAPIGYETFPAGSTAAEDLLFLPPAANALAGKEDGEVSQFDIENSLRFNNNIALVTVTAEELLALMNHGVADSGDGNTPGRFPQVAGMAFSFDTGLEAGSRIRSLALVDDAGTVIDTIARDGALVGDAARTIRIATLGFLAGGGDGYPFPAADAPETNLVDLRDVVRTVDVDPTFEAGGEQDALAEFLATFHPEQASAFAEAEADPADDTRIQDLGVREDTVLDAR